MIEITIPADFQPERRYIIDVFCSTFYNIPHSIKINPASKSYSLGYQGQTLEIQDHFFSRHKEEQGYLSVDSLPQKIVEASHPELQNVVILYGEDELSSENGTVLCKVDLFASAFFMLTRWEETVKPDRDGHQRFPLTSSLAYQFSFYKRAIVNEYASLFKTLLEKIGVKIESVHTYSKLITCDVDHPFFWKKGGVIRKILGPIFRQGSIQEAIRRYHSYRKFTKGLQNDPYDTFGEMMDAAESQNLQMCFFFPTGGEHALDCQIELDSPAIRDLINNITNRGHTIGLHPGYRSMEDLSLFSKEKKLLESVTGTEILMSRQHFLRCNLPETWRNLAQEGIRHDMTVGYPESPGFRCGTCTPYPVFDVVERSVLEIIEHPLIVMDVSLRSYLELNPQQSLDQIKSVVEEVRQHRGEFVLLWHNSSFNFDGWEGYKKVFDAVLTS